MPTHFSAAIPCLRYRDASAAIDGLCRAFGLGPGEQRDSQPT